MRQNLGFGSMQARSFLLNITFIAIPSLPPSGLLQNKIHARNESKLCLPEYFSVSNSVTKCHCHGQTVKCKEKNPPINKDYKFCS